MKGYAAAPAPPAKRRCKGITVAVLALGLCSLALPLALLFGRIPSGYLADERSSTEATFGGYYHADDDRQQEEPEDDQSRIEDLVRKFGPTFPKEVIEGDMREADGSKKTNSEPIGDSAHIISEPTEATSHSNPKDITYHTEGPPAKQKAPPAPDMRDGGKVEKSKHASSSTGDESERSCQLEFGSYCLWSIKHKEVLKDSMVKRLKDQLFVARAYYPSIAKLQGHDKLTRESKQHIQEHERMLSEAISDADLPPFLEKRIQKMDQIIARARSCRLECSNVEKKLRQILDLTEDEAHFHMKQSAFLYHLASHTMPKSLHCLSMRLTIESLKSESGSMEQFDARTLDNPCFQHYVIFSRNVLAASVAINSTVMHSEETGNMVFHILTDAENFYAMKFWFARNPCKKAVIHVLNLEDLCLNHSYDRGRPRLSLSEEFRVSVRNIDRSSPFQMRTEYVSVFGHSHFLLPEIFKTLKKAVVIDDDVVVQRDLSALWSLDLGGKVNGAVEFCGVRLGQLKTYLGGSDHDGDACAWMSGVNIVDLEKWREYNVTGTYQQLLGKLQDGSEASFRAAALPISLLAFQDLIYALDDSWVVSGLGHDYGVGAEAIKSAAALHYDGNMKPWLDLGIPAYKGYWKKFLPQGERFMDDCNVNP